MAIFGKALSNGYAITSVIGKSKIMEAAQKTFISSTFWTERIGPVAGLATLKVMKKKIMGKDISYRRFKQMENCLKYNLDFNIGGIKPIPYFI